MEPDNPEMGLLAAAVSTQEVSRRTAAISKSLPGQDAIGEYDLAAMVTDLEQVGQQCRQASGAIVAVLRLRGKTWQEIGELLGLTRQGAQQRYSQPETDTELATHPLERRLRLYVIVQTFEFEGFPEVESIETLHCDDWATAAPVSRSAAHVQPTGPAQNDRHRHGAGVT